MVDSLVTGLGEWLFERDDAPLRPMAPVDAALLAAGGCTYRLVYERSLACSKRFTVLSCELLVASIVMFELEVLVLSEEINPLVEILGAVRVLGLGPPGGGGGKEGVEPTFGNADADDACASSLLLDCTG